MAKKAESNQTTPEQKSEYISISSGLPVELKEVEKVLKVIAKELEHENKKYFAYDVIKKNGDKVKLKFVRIAKNVPVTEGTHHIQVNESDINIDTWSKVYPVMWCKNVIDILHCDNKEKNEKIKESLSEF